MGLHELLKKHSFSSHPFDTFKAEDERIEDLKEWYIDPPFLADIVGLDSGPWKARSHVVFGAVGTGKTALRRMLENRFLALPPGGAPLLVRYGDFTRVLQEGNSRVALHSHIDEIVAAGATSLLFLWHESPDRYDRLGIEERRELAGLILQYFDSLSPDAKNKYITSLSPYYGRLMSWVKSTKGVAADAYNALVSVLRKEKFEPTKWVDPDPSAARRDPIGTLRRFWNLARAMGVPSVCVVVERVEESGAAKTGAEIFNCLADLLLNLHVMEFREGDDQVIGFKVLLTRPDEVLKAFQEAQFRKDRITVRVIKWERGILSTALQKRLAHYSNKRILHFDTICQPELRGTHDQLVDLAGNSPRSLFILARDIFTVFAESGRPEATELDRDTVTRGIELGKQSLV